ncbi:hypothetical protein [Phyllobacterium sp. K27]
MVVIAKYDADIQLMAVYLTQTDRTMLKAKRRMAPLPKQKIMPGNIGKVEALRVQIPTPRWRESMVEGDELFNVADIATAETALNAFVDSVKAANLYRNAVGTITVLKKNQLKSVYYCGAKELNFSRSVSEILN